MEMSLVKRVLKSNTRMKIHKAYRTEIAPNNYQRTALLKHAGAARFAYNWGLSRKIEDYRSTGKSPSAIDLHMELNRLKKINIEDGGCPWMYEVSKAAPQEALRNLDKAFRNFFRRCKQGAAKKGFPRFKSRKRGIGSFRLTGLIEATKTHVRLPRLGRIRLKEHGYLPTPDRIGTRVLSATVSERAGKWFVSLQVEQEINIAMPSSTTEHVVGVDVGIKELAVTSDGEIFSNPKSLRKSEKKLKQVQRSFSRKVKGSANQKKAKARLAKQHYQIKCRRHDAIHKATSAITKSCATVVIESLNVAGMIKNRHLSKALMDASLAEFHRQIIYKMGWRGGDVMVADKFFPSSKTCSNCGAIKNELGLDERTYICSQCGLQTDRDLNAALNLKNLSSTVGSTGFQACGDGSAGSVRRVKLPSLKQEPNTIVLDGQVLENRL